ncbi:MAG: ABC transporter permease [Minisyncoccia bacterium]|jgi:putative ABC transport system permease protein
MIVSDIFEETYLALLVNKARSFLTVLGIVIGIGSVIAMVSVGQGAQNSIQSSIASLGSNLILVSPGFSRTAGPVNAGRGSATSLTQADADAIAAQVTNAVAVAPENSRRYQVVAPGMNTNTTITGTVPSYASARNISIDEGSFISDDNVTSMARVAVLGPTTRDDLFGTGGEAVGQEIRINGLVFKVIGVTVSRGTSGFNNLDDMIIIPISTAQHLLAGNTNVTSISIEAPDTKSMSAIQQQVTDLLMQRHNISDPTAADFQVQNQADIAAAASSVTGTFTMLLASIAGISLLVGGIGIMNMMLTTVTERIREIGLRKAIGAKKRDINLQFLAEAVMLTLIGGIIGVVFGFVASLAITKFAGIKTSVSPSSILLAFGVSAAIGIIFGYYPARRAASLNPIEALRYE